MMYIGNLKEPTSAISRKARFIRFEKLKALGCIACRKQGRISFPVDIHHLNLGGRAGNKRRGDAYTIPLCLWHHRGVVGSPRATVQTRQLLGPSLAKQSKAFRAQYGTDEELLAEVNELIGA